MKVHQMLDGIGQIIAIPITSERMGWYGMPNCCKAGYRDGRRGPVALLSKSARSRLGLRMQSPLPTVATKSQCFWLCVQRPN